MNTTWKFQVMLILTFLAAIVASSDDSCYKYGDDPAKCKYCCDESCWAISKDDKTGCQCSQKNDSASQDVIGKLSAFPWKQCPEARKATVCVTCCHPIKYDCYKYNPDHTCFCSMDP